MSLGDDWIVGEVISLSKDESRNFYYEFKYKEGPSVFVSVSDIAAIEKIELADKSGPRLIHLKSVK